MPFGYHRCMSDSLKASILDLLRTDEDVQKAVITVVADLSPPVADEVFRLIQDRRHELFG